MTTEKQIQTNRKNAKKSSGPRDTSKSKYNALKHGILSKSIVIQTGEGKEDPKEFNRILNSLVADFDPQSTVEHMIVERLAVAYWRMRRVLLAEKGFIKEALDRIPDDVLRLDESPFNTGYSYRSLDKTLCEVEAEIEDVKNGELDKNIDELERLKKDLELLLSYKEEKLNAREEMLLCARRIPNQDVAENILRYDVAVQRDFYRALHEIQKIRNEPNSSPRV